MMNNDRVVGLQRIFLIVAGLAALWAVAVILSGGLVLQVGAFRILSSRSARTPQLSRC